tara:strand:+ start:554 stop:898 length:345 start_codon:yes stop_codon:yes gene_type:complete
MLLVGVFTSKRGCLVSCSEQYMSVHPRRAGARGPVSMSSDDRGSRQAEAKGLRKKYPSRVPVLLEVCFEVLDQKRKFLVPEEMSMGGFLGVLRTRFATPSSYMKLYKYHCAQQR